MRKWSPCWRSQSQNLTMSLLGRSEVHKKKICRKFEFICNVRKDKAVEKPTGYFWSFYFIHYHQLEWGWLNHGKKDLDVLNGNQVAAL